MKNSTSASPTVRRSVFAAAEGAAAVVVDPISVVVVVVGVVVLVDAVVVVLDVFGASFSETRMRFMYSSFRPEDVGAFDLSCPFVVEIVAVVDVMLMLVLEVVLVVLLGLGAAVVLVDASVNVSSGNVRAS